MCSVIFGSFSVRIPERAGFLVMTSSVGPAPERQKAAPGVLTRASMLS